jgi:hypothetical protein
MVMLYTGGNCSQSENMQGEQGVFECFDFGDGPPLEGTAIPSYSFIKVVLLKDENEIYHEGYVEVGQKYEFFIPDGEHVASDLNITIYSDYYSGDYSDDYSDDYNEEYGGEYGGYGAEPQFLVLQTLKFRSSCSSNLFVKDRFGASQLVEFENTDQGIISAFAPFIFFFQFSNPVDSVGNITLTSATIGDTKIGIFDDYRCDKRCPIRLAPGESYSSSFFVDFDLTRNYTGLTTITGVTDQGVECRDTTVADTPVFLLTST